MSWFCFELIRLILWQSVNCCVEFTSGHSLGPAVVKRFWKVTLDHRFSIGQKGEDVIVELKSTATKIVWFIDLLVIIFFIDNRKEGGAGWWEGKCGKYSSKLKRRKMESEKKLAWSWKGRRCGVLGRKSVKQIFFWVDKKVWSCLEVLITKVFLFGFKRIEGGLSSLCYWGRLGLL